MRNDLPVSFYYIFLISIPKTEKRSAKNMNGDNSYHVMLCGLCIQSTEPNQAEQSKGTQRNIIWVCDSLNSLILKW